MRRFAFALLLPLAACATPRQQCEAAATQDLNVVSSLIVETEQTLARGYAITREVRERSVLQFCYGNTLTGDEDFIGMSFCNSTEAYTVEIPVAIDVAAEQSKLRSLRAKQIELRRRSQLALAACAVNYPEG